MSRKFVLATLDYRRPLFILLFVVMGELSAQPSSNVSLFGSFIPVPFRYSGSWGFTSPTGQEYALLGGNPGTYIASIDDSTSIQQLAFIPGPSSNWREIVVIGGYGYVVTEGSGAGAGMQVIDLTNLPTGAPLLTTYTSTFTRAHIISRDVSSDSPYVYVNGTSSTSGVHIMNVSNPANPVQVGLYRPAYYIHDSHIRGNRMYASALNQGMDIVDITNKSAPVLLRKITYPSQFTHSCWTSEDHKYLFVADEQDGLPARIWNIENLSNVFEVAQYSGNLQSLVHNPYIRGDLAFISHNTEGLRVVDIKDPALPVEVGFYDTFGGPSGGFNGLWSAYPYFPSGKIIGGDRERGLLVWRFNGTRAGRIYGLVTDSITAQPLQSVQVSLLETGRSTSSNAGGFYKIGELPGPPAGYTLGFSKAGYVAKSMNISLAGGDSLWIAVQLAPTGLSVGEPDELPRTLVLEQNYPNPFNSSTRIVYRVGSQESVSLKVFDVLGQEVATLVNEVKPPGVYAVQFDGSNLASGIYFYTLRAGPFAEARKLLLLK